MKRNNMDISNSLDLYILGYYWTIVTFATVGFGDLFPTTINSKLVFCFIFIIFSIIFALTINFFSFFLGESYDEIINAY